jgi:hypothetical protein
LRVPISQTFGGNMFDFKKAEREQSEKISKVIKKVGSNEKLKELKTDWITILFIILGVAGLVIAYLEFMK